MTSKKSEIVWEVLFPFIICGSILFCTWSVCSCLV